ncbi:MAG: hypothetical protein JWP81_2472 [Ferruginibacter sp.]|nr:hypothetical protein [Ferruginibacter sp.]
MTQFIGKPRAFSWSGRILFFLTLLAIMAIGMMGEARRPISPAFICLAGGSIKTIEVAALPMGFVLRSNKNQSFYAT